MTSFAMASTAERRRFLLRHGAMPAVVFAVMATALELSSFDRRVAALFASEQEGFFAARAWWANEILHVGGRNFVLAIGLVAMLLSAAWWRPVKSFRRPALFTLSVMALGPGSVALLKDVTNVDCPRDLIPFGGTRPYVRLFEDKPDDLPRGQCWPGGHSSGAFSLLSLYFVAREREGWPERGVLALAVGLGGLFSFGQWVRGAHFVSHDLWSAAICWFMSLSLYLFVFRGRLWSLPEANGEERRVRLVVHARRAVADSFRSTSR